jgi:5-methylcytosine-specific restriction endonuclease McrBC regulatory subunit McrC
LFAGSDLYLRYPDFYKKWFVLDAKYKQLNKRDISADDMHQIISYMHVEKAVLGGFIYPYSANEENTSTNPKYIGTLRGYGGEVKIWSMAIPQESTNWDDFTKNIRENKETLCANEDFKVEGR